MVIDALIIMLYAAGMLQGQNTCLSSSPHLMFNNISNQLNIMQPVHVAGTDMPEINFMA